MQAKMPLVFQKLSNFLKVSVFITRIGKPIIPKLIFLKKSATARPCNYGFVHHYQFSPSTTTPLIHYYRSGQGPHRRRRRHVYSLLFLCRSCLGSGSFRDGDYRVEEAEAEALKWSDDQDDSIDYRAELFIQKFYEGMKMESLAMAMPVPSI